MSGSQQKAVDLAKLVDELDGMYDGSAVYVNRTTGEIVTVLDEELSAIEEGTGEDELEADEVLPVLRSIAETTEWVRMPDKFEIHEWQIMSNFADEIGGNLGDRLARAIRGRGAFRMFKDLIYEQGIEQSWFEFKLRELKRIAAAALEEEGLHFQ